MVQIYHFPSLTKEEFIDKFDGRIVIGQDAFLNLIEGNAISRTDENKNIIKGEFLLGKFELVQEGPALIIKESGLNPNNENREEIIIKNFPFYSGGFSILLNKKISGLNNSPLKYSDPDLFNRSAFSQDDIRGRFFAPAKIESANGEKNYAIKYYDSKGFCLDVSLISNFLYKNNENPTDENPNIDYYLNNNFIAHKTTSGNVAFLYCAVQEHYGTNNNKISEKSLSFLTIIDSKGNIIFNQQISENISKVQPACIAINNDGEYFACFDKAHQSFICQKFDQNLGNLIGEKFEQDSLEPLIRQIQHNEELQLKDGSKVILDVNNGFKIYYPIYENDNEVFLNYFLEDGETSIKAAEKQSVTFCEEFETIAKLEENPNSIILFSGLITSGKSKIDLRHFNIISSDELIRNIRVVKSSQYSIKDILNQKFNFDDLDPNLENLFAQDNPVNISSSLRQIDPLWILIKLPNNQIMAFADFNLDEFISEINGLFLLN